MAQHIGELSDRMREIFGLVVESYLDRGAPVGSKVLAGSVNLSPASIRGVMQDLEERGLLRPPRVLPRYLHDPATPANLARAVGTHDLGTLLEGHA